MEKVKPLARFPMISTDRVEEAEFKLSQSITELEITNVDNRRCFQLELNAANFGRVSLLYNRFGTNTEINARMDVETVIFVIGSRIPSTFYVDNKSYLVSPQKAVVVAPAKQLKVERPRNSELFFLRVPLSDLSSHFETLTRKHHRGSLNFNRSVNLTIGPGAMLEGLMNYLSDELNNSGSILKIPSLRKGFDDTLMTALLSLPHNKIDKLYADHSQKIAPGLVRRAEEYIRAHLSKPVTISDLVRVCNCSRSVLFSTFRNARGYTPMEFLTEQRLHVARKKLLKVQYDASIASIAMDCGFISQSWFSQVYRKRFGERPSETLLKAR
jgi:AraC-like DNA-binding protein